MHQNAEIGFEEVVTQKSITDFLLKKGIPKASIKKSALTGLVKAFSEIFEYIPINKKIKINEHRS